MESHYFSKDCFMSPDQLRDGAGRLARIPGLIVQGRYDLLCPPATSHALAAVWREAEIRIVEGAGHMAPYEQPSAVASAIAAALG